MNPFHVDFRRWNFCGVSALCAGVGIFLVMLTVAQPAPAQTYTVIHSFGIETSDGAIPGAQLIADAAGNLYGTTTVGGADNCGTVFKLNSTGVETVLYNFTCGNDGQVPEGGLFRDPAGNLYGTTLYGGTSGDGTFRDGFGTVFKLDTDNVLTTLHNFMGGTDGQYPSSRVVSVNGDLYGTTPVGGGSKCGGKGCGTIFKITKGGLITILYRFDDGPNGGGEGFFPPSGLIRDSAGNLYGVASFGGENNTGTVFKLDTSGVFSVLYSFASQFGSGGSVPVGRLTRNDQDGSLTGLAGSGGDASCLCGVIFRVDMAGGETVIHRFFGHGGGDLPAAGLLDVGGVLYGTTDQGGDPSCGLPAADNQGCGVIYQVDRSGKYTVLHRFAGAAAGDGADIENELTRGEDGSIYGVTNFGGTGTTCGSNGVFPGCGTIFKYTP
jgi:uncharacterized repeat protein (TIGR03803 family)